MTDETALAFDAPEARAAATSGAAMLDRISVRDYTKDVEIGAFQSERGVRQRIRFNVVLEVSSHAAAQTDDVDQVLSYDTIVEAIELVLQTERINLLETLAERIAETVLLEPKAVRIFVRIEKLDRIPGTLGIEIARSKIDALNVTSLQETIAPKDAEIHPLVVFLPNEILHSEQLGAWLDQIDAHELPAIICLEQILEPAIKTGIDAVDLRLGLLSIEQNAWVLASRDDRCVVVDSRTELDWAMKNGQMSVWAPSKVVLDAVEKPEADADNPLGLAQWFAQEFSADQVTICGAFDGAQDTPKSKIVLDPKNL